MAVEIATAYVALTTSARGIQDSVRRDLDPLRGHAGNVGDDAGKRLHGGMRSGLTSLAGITGGLFAVDKLTDFFGSAIAEATESAKVNALTAQVIESTGGAAGVSAEQVGSLATSISNYSGVDDEAIQAGENLLLTFTNVKNGVGEGNDVFDQATVTALDMSKALGQDMNTSVMQLGKALNDPIKGMSALQRVGVTFTQGQKDQITAMVKSGDTMGAQKIILAELNREFGGAAKAMVTPAEKMQVAWGNFKEMIGTALMPIIGKLADFATTTLIPALAGIFGWIDRNSTVVGILAGAVLTIVIGMGILVGILKIATIVQLIWNAALWSNPIFWIVAAIVGLVVIIVLVITHLDFFKGVWNAVWKAVSDAITNVMSWIRANWPLLLAILTGPIGLAVFFIVKHWQDIQNATTAVKNWIVARWNDVMGFFAGLPGRVAGLAVRLWAKAQEVTGAIKDWVVARWNDVMGFFGGIPGRISGVAARLWSKAQEVTGAIKDWVVARWNDVMGFFGGIPGRISGIANSLWNGLKEATTNAYNWVVGKLGGIADYVTGLPGRIGGVLSSLWDGLTNAARAAFNLVATMWNATLGGVRVTIPSWVPFIGGNSFSFPTMPHFASGGMLQPGWNLVGELGPELVNMAGGSARVFSNAESNSMINRAGSGQQQQQVTIHKLVEFSGPVTVRSDQDLLDLSRGIARETNRQLRAAGTSVALSGATP